MRQGELFGLTVDRIDHGRAVIVVNRQMTKTTAGLTFGPPNTPASARIIPVPAELFAVIDEHVQRFGYGIDGLVFTAESGGPISHSRFSDRWRPAPRAAGLPPGQGIHRLRHFYASLLIRSGCSVKVVQSRLGHATASETLDTYAHLWPDDGDRTRAAVSSMLVGH
jgi:integrase